MYFTHAYREVNKCADWAANLACCSDKIIALYGDTNLKCEAKSLIEVDSIQMKQPVLANHNF